MSEQNDRGEPVRIDLAELKRLEAAATPGEWHSAEHYVCVTKPNGLPQPIIICPFSEADAALIAAARNALPALIALAERAQELERENAALRRKLVDLLSRYAVHQQACRDAFTHAVSMRMPLPGCTCGYDRDVLPVIEEQRDG